MPTRPAKSVRRELLGAALTDHDHVEADITDLDHFTTADHNAIDAADHGSGAATDGQVLTADGSSGAAWEAASAHGGHVTNGDTHDHSGGDGAQVDHGGLAGLADDDHTQYLTDARHNSAHSVLRAERGTSDQAIAHATDTVVILNSLIAEDDPDGDFSLNTTTGEVTINNAGWYLIVVGSIWESSSGGTLRQMFVRVNGTNLGQTLLPPIGTTPNGTSVIGQLAATDVVTFVVRQNTGGSLNLLASTSTNFTIAKLRE